MSQLPNLAEKRQAAIAALRGDLGVNEPAKAPAAPPQAPAEAQAPASDKPQPPPEYMQAMLEYDQRRKAAEAEYSKAQEAQAQAQKLMAEAEAKQKRLQDSLNDPLSFIAENNMTADEWQAFLLNGGKRDPQREQLKAMEQTLKQQQEELAAFKKEQAQYQRSLQRNEVVSTLKQQMDWSQYPLVEKISGGAEFILKQIEDHHRQTGQELHPDVVAKHFEQQYRSQLGAYLQDPNIKSILMPGESTGATQPPQSPLAASPQTLNSRLTSNTGPAGALPAPTDWAAKRQRAIAELQRLNA